MRLAGLPSPTAWLPEICPLPGVVWLHRIPTDTRADTRADTPAITPSGTPADVPGSDKRLQIDENGRLRLTREVRDWLTLTVHLPPVTSTTAATPAAPGNVTPLHQIVVVAAPPYESITLSASWILGPLLAPALSRLEMGLAT